MNAPKQESATTVAASAPKPVTVTVIADNHKHAGQPVAKGEQLTVDKTTAKWLVDNKVAAYAGGQADTTKEATR